MSSAIADATALESARRRPRQLAALDRAKTMFFSNVSHELRTPLTLMLGPLEDMLGKPDGPGPGDRDLVEMAHRNAVRLLRQVVLPRAGLLVWRFPTLAALLAGATMSTCSLAGRSSRS